MTIRDQIATILVKHRYLPFMECCDCDHTIDPDGKRNYSQARNMADEGVHEAHVADVLVNELGLTQEDDADFAGGQLTRYVTAWQTPE